jgi:hypothetical protein
MPVMAVVAAVGSTSAEVSLWVPTALVVTA